MMFSLLYSFRYMLATPIILLSIYYTENSVKSIVKADIIQGGENEMPIVYRIDILTALKDAGYNTNRLRKERLLSEGVIQSLRTNKYVSLGNISKICEMLNCQPADLLEYCADDECV